MVKLTYLSATRFSGVDAGSFLHAQLSADILALASGDAVFACYCEPKGRVLALLLVHRVNEDYYVIMSRALTSAVTERLKIYRMRSKVNIDVLNDYWIAGLQADDAEPASGKSLAIRLPGNGHWLVVTPDEITVDTSAHRQEEWKISELRLGITWLTPATSGEFLPQMLGFEELGAVNYRKGCYPGQEIVARTHYLGKVKRHPRLLNCKLADCPEPMEKINIFNDGQIYDAIVADCGLDADGNVCLLAVTRMEPDLTARQIEYRGEVTAVF
jgi:folate-binding protein YgfZ